MHLGPFWVKYGVQKSSKENKKIIAHTNSTDINFGFSKGDDAHGIVKRKELDDFCKSLCKQVNLGTLQQFIRKSLRHVLGGSQYVLDLGF